MLKKLGPENQMGPLCIGALGGLCDIIHQSMYMYMLEFQARQKWADVLRFVENSKWSIYLNSDN